MRSLSRRRDLADRLMLGRPAGAGLPAREEMMLAYARKLTLQPAAVTPVDVAELRACEFPDAAIVDIALHTALFAAWNRIVDGLGGSVPPGLLEEADRLRLPHAWGAAPAA